jgi:hypothetical protein
VSCIVACIVHPCQARVGGMQVPHHTAACRGRGSSHRTAKLYADENLAHTNTRQACVGTVRHTDTRTGAVGRSTTLRRDRNRNHCRDIIIEMLSCRLADGRSHLPKREARRRDPTCEESTCEASAWMAPTAARAGSCVPRQALSFFGRAEHDGARVRSWVGAAPRWRRDGAEMAPRWRCPFDLAA